MGRARQTDRSPHSSGTAHAVAEPVAVGLLRFGSLVLAVVAALHPGAAQPESAKASLQVSAQVLPHVRLQGDSAPVAITAADIQRGYRDVSRHYRFVTNAPDRIVLQLNPRLGLTDSIDIEGFQSPVRMKDSSLEITQPWGREFTLTYRLWLSAGAVPGEYELPVQVAARVR
jgi:hypothetical protein